jgi:hypothetical protein
MILIFYPSRIHGSKRHRIPDPDPQHCFWSWTLSLRSKTMYPYGVHHTSLANFITCTIYLSLTGFVWNFFLLLKASILYCSWCGLVLYITGKKLLFFSWQVYRYLAQGPYFDYFPLLLTIFRPIKFGSVASERIRILQSTGKKLFFCSIVIM